MSALRNSAERAAASGRLPMPGAAKRLAIEKVAETLRDRAVGDVRDDEPWDVFLRRIGVISA